MNDAALPILTPGTAPDPATLIRRVAGIIRERAQNATPGTWGDSPEVGHGFHVDAHHEGNSNTVAWTGDDEDGDAYQNMLHIAGMQPQVASALADWLERIADQHPASLDSPECPQCDNGGCEHPDVLGCDTCLEDYPCWPVAPAFELARRFWNGIATFTAETVPPAAGALPPGQVDGQAPCGFRLGDLVEITGRVDEPQLAGRTGFVSEIDDYDPELPFGLTVEGWLGLVWCASSEIRRVESGSGAAK